VDECKALRRGATFCKDPNGKRDGDAPIAAVATMLRKALDDAAMACSKKQVEYKKALTKRELSEHVDIIRGAVMIAYPMGKTLLFTSLVMSHQSCCPAITPSSS